MPSSSSTRRYLDVTAQGQSNDEFWYLCVPNDLENALQSCGSTDARRSFGDYSFRWNVASKPYKPRGPRVARSAPRTVLRTPCVEAAARDAYSVAASL